MDFSSRRAKPLYNTLNKRSFRFLDYSLLLIVLSLMMLGLLSLYSASGVYAEGKGLSQLFFVKRQALWMILGGAAALWIYRLDLEKARPYVKPAMLATLALLVLTLFMPKVAGARRWIPLGFMKLQTSEFAKIVLIFYLADYFDHNLSRLMASWKQLLKPFAVTCAALILIAAEPDIGTPALMFATTMMLAYAAGVRPLYLFAPILAAVPVVIFELLRKPYRIARLKVFLSPWENASGTGYQLVQALLAVGSGGWLGKGLGASKLKLLYLPEPHTDFIFPVIAEELGLLGGLLITGLFAALLVKGMRAARNAPSFFTSLVATGLTLSICLQAFFNIAMTIGLIPTKGLPLPFFSYGGSSILATMIAVGVILNISAHRSAQKW